MCRHEQTLPHIITLLSHVISFHASGLFAFCTCRLFFHHVLLSFCQTVNLNLPTLTSVIDSLVCSLINEHLLPLSSTAFAMCSYVLSQSSRCLYLERSPGNELCFLRHWSRAQNHGNVKEAQSTEYFCRGSKLLWPAGACRGQSSSPYYVWFNVSFMLKMS